MKFTGHGRLALDQQAFNLRLNPISASGRGGVAGGVLVWCCDLAPTLLSRTYAIRLEYRLRDKPTVFVESPNLEILASGRKLPHVYRNPLRLCLYLPGAGEWGPWMLLDRTILPWATLWLFYFEEWLRTGEWLGGGVHPDGRRDRLETCEK